VGRLVAGVVLGRVLAQSGGQSVKQAKFLASWLSDKRLGAKAGQKRTHATQARKTLLQGRG